MSPRQYASATAFRQALETRLKTRAADHDHNVNRLRRLLAFDRLLARLFADTNAPWIVKGGFALEVRYGLRARTTKDIDLSLPDATPIATLLAALQAAVRRDVGDLFAIVIQEPVRDLDAPAGGARFPVRTMLDGRDFTGFHLDVGIGDAVVEPPEWHSGEPFLAFAGIAAARFPVLALPQQFAEKIHAYTHPRGDRINTRAHDLVDMMLLCDLDPPPLDRLRRALRATFERQGSHPIPRELPPPPAIWPAAFARMAQDTKRSPCTHWTRLTNA